MRSFFLGLGAGSPRDVCVRPLRGGRSNLAGGLSVKKRPQMCGLFVSDRVELGNGRQNPRSAEDAFCAYSGSLIESAHLRLFFAKVGEAMGGRSHQ